MDILIRVVEFVHWPVAFFLFSIISIIILEPLSAPSNTFVPENIKKIILQKFLDFGKTFPVKGRDSHFVKYFTVPKSWFRHFYVVSSSVGVCSCLLVGVVYVLNASPPSSILTALDLITSSNRLPNDSSLLSIVSIVLLTVQCCARLHECYNVSVFSTSGVMNLLQYAVGFCHYIFAFSILLAHTPALNIVSPDFTISCTFPELCRASVAAVLFGVAFLVQRDSMRRLAALRDSDNSKGKYVMPFGGGFEFVSCPHMTAECFMYCALSLLQTNWPWITVLLFVLSNQVRVALSNHRWYKAQFKKYPSKRMAIIPLLL